MTVEKQKARQKSVLVIDSWLNGYNKTTLLTVY
jgi:hypothetical protein